MVSYVNADSALSGLTKKTVCADKILSTILSVNEGELVSYAQLSKGLHRYIKEKGLKKTSAELPTGPEPMAQEAVHVAEPVISPGMKRCRDCNAQIPSEAVFCDICGVSQ